MLEYASVRSHLGGVLPRKKIETLELCMGALCPSLHFIRDYSRAFISNENTIKFAPFRSLFECSAVLNAEALTLSDFSAQDFVTMFGSLDLKDIVFENLQFLSISQSPGREHGSSVLRFPPCPKLRRFYLDSHTNLSYALTSIVTAFCWKTLTHLSANLKLRICDWYLILEQCVNLSYGSFFLVLLQSFIDNRGVIHHRSLKMLSIRAMPQHLEVALDASIFPSITALRICCTESPTSLGIVHQLLKTSPAVKELHLQSCIPFGLPGFLRQPQTTSLGGTLSKFAPHLLTFVIPIDYTVPVSAIPRDLRALLHSSWLNEGWLHSSHTQKSVEFILDKSRPFCSSIINSIGGEIDLTVSLSFRVSCRYVQGGLWTWQQPTLADLRDRWNDLLAFYCQG